MTFRVETVLDLTFACPSGHEGDEHPTDLDSRTWTCRTCHQSVSIVMDDQVRGHFTVERRPAREICEGDLIVFRENATFTAKRVTRSDLHRSKKGIWRLAVEDFGSADVPSGQYISRVL